MDDQKISFFRPTSAVWDLPDEQFLKAVSWDGKASKAIVQIAAKGDVESFSRTLQNHCVGMSPRKSSKKKNAFSGDFTKQVLWSRGAFDETPAETALSDIWSGLTPKTLRLRSKKTISRQTQSAKSVKSKKKRCEQTTNVSDLRDWLERITPEETVSPVGCLMVFDILREAGSSLPADVCWKLWRLALSLSVEWSAAPPDLNDRREHPDRSLLIQGELAWCCGVMMGGVDGARRFSQQGRKVLCREILGKTDTDGTPAAELMSRLSFWLAPFVRAAELSRLYKTPLWDEESGERFHELQKAVAPMCRADGRLALSNGSSRNVVDLLTVGSRLAGWKKKSHLLTYLSGVERRPKKKRKSGRVQEKSTKLGKNWPVAQSDWAQLACLRNNWSVDADVLLVTHHREQPEIDLSILGDALLSGMLDMKLQVDGKPLHFENDWSCSCWFSDKDADYIELQASFEDPQVHIERLFLLSRDEHFLILADSISAGEGVKIEYSTRLPLASDVSCESDDPTREFALTSSEYRARVFPLALPAEKVHSTSGQFTTNGEALELTQHGIGGLFAPLVIDWHPGRSRSYADWRTLTITLDGQKVKPNVAAGHRLRIGKHQLFVYRSLMPSEIPRAVLGYHTANETVIGKFTAKGEVDPLLLVE